MKLRLILIGAGVMATLVVARLALAPSVGPVPDEVAVDTTGASAVASAARAVAAPTPAAAALGEPAAAPAATSAAITPTAEPVPAEPTGAPAVVRVQGTPISIERRPLVLLNPTTVRHGSTIGVTGSGFDAGATVDLVLKRQAGDTGDALAFVQVDKSGGFGGMTFPVPDSLPRGSFIVEARQRNSEKVARATVVVAGGSPQVKLGTQVGKAGDVIVLSAEGFAPDEDVDVCWNTLQNAPITVLHTDGNGAVRQATIPVPFGAVGNNAFVFVGTKSQSPVSVVFQLLNLYPSVELSSYAIKPDNALSVSGKDFGPGERVLVYLNNPDSPPITTLQTDANGAFSNAGGFVVPFGLRGKQTLIYVGEQSRAPTTASFDTLPYTPNVQPSTYGGRPGTALAFYASGFARTEVVRAYLARTRDDPGHEVSCFMTDSQGNAAAAGSYIIPGNARAGQLIFTLLGSKSQAAATAALEVIASDVPVQVPAPPEFKCSLDDGSGTRSSTPQASTATPLPVPTPQAQPSPTTTVSRTARQEIYTVRMGDTLASIARTFYGNPEGWRRLLDANRDLLAGDPESLKPGMLLQIPSADA
jgi:hypothetical protein